MDRQIFKPEKSVLEPGVNRNQADAVTPPKTKGKPPKTLALKKQNCFSNRWKTMFITRST